MGIGGKTYPLSIVVGTVDKATASFERINKQISRLTAPVRRLNNRLGALGRAAGVGALGPAWRKAGDALGGVVGQVKGMAVGLLGIAGAAGFGAHEVLGLVENQNKLGETAGRLGLTVDAYASLRGAAKAAGIENEDLDGSMETFGVTLAKTRSGIGRFAGLLKVVSPALLKQVKATKTNEEGFLLMADAIAKVKDPAKQATLATAAFGGAGARMVTLLKGGSKGVKAAMAEYLRLAGSQEESVKRAMAADDAFDRLDASLDGVKATIVTALAPAFGTIADKVQMFLVGHKDQIAAWAADFGNKLPGAIDRIFASINQVIGPIKQLWDFIGGAGGAVRIFEGVMAIKVVGALTSVGSALGTTIGLVGKLGLSLSGLDPSKLAGLSSSLLGIAGKAGAVGAAGAAGFGLGTLLTDTIPKAFGAKRGLGEVIGDQFGPDQASRDRASAASDAAAKGSGKGKMFLGNRQITAEELAALRLGGGRQTNDARVHVDFANLPPGARATTDPSSTAEINLTSGYQLVPG